MVKVLIVDDSDSVCKNLQTMLCGIPSVELAGHAIDEAGAIERIDSLLPDTVILDIHLQQGSGLNVLKHIRKYHAAIKVIVLSNNADKFYIRCCKLFGANIFLEKYSQLTLVAGVLEQLISSEEQLENMSCCVWRQQPTQQTANFWNGSVI